MRADRVRRSRSGHTLVELLVVMTLMSVLTGLCIALIDMLFNFEQAGRDHMTATTTIGRLGRDFRDDVNHARSVQVPDGLGDQPTQMTLLQNEGRSVEYRVEKDQVIRIEREGKNFHKKERFRLPAKGARFTHRQEGNRTEWALVFASRLNKSAGISSAEHRIEATLGRANRFSPESTP